jgi:hypothetical protein
MASIDELDDYLKPVAVLVPAVTVAMMGTLELRLRAEWLLELQSRMAVEPPEKAERTGRLMKRAARSMSDAAFSDGLAEISGRVSEARQRGDSQGIAHLLAEARHLEQQNPRLPVDRLTGHAAGVAMKITESKLPPIPSPAKSRLFSRNRNRK